MRTEVLQRYLDGDAQAESAAVQILRAIGETAARRRGLQPCDVDAVGVDFAAHILTGGASRYRRTRGSLDSYIRRAARWYAANQSRLLRQQETVLSGLPDDPAQPTALLDVPSKVALQLMLEAVERIVAGLPPRDRELYDLCIRDGRKSNEVAERMGCTAVAVRKRVQRLKAKLKQALWDLYVDDSGAATPPAVAMGVLLAACTIAGVLAGPSSSTGGVGRHLSGPKLK